MDAVNITELLFDGWTAFPQQKTKVSANFYDLLELGPLHCLILSHFSHLFQSKKSKVKAKDNCNLENIDSGWALSMS